MQTTNRFLDDLAKVANGAVSTLVGVRDEIRAAVRQRIERLLVNADAVPREEFDAVKAMAAKARAEQERLEKRLAALESKLAEKRTPARRGGRKETAEPAATAARKPATKKASARRAARQR